MPPAYFYHLKFDLQDYCPQPLTAFSSHAPRGTDSTRPEVPSQRQGAKDKRATITWTPPPGADIFDSREGVWTGERGAVTRKQGGKIKKYEADIQREIRLQRDWRFGKISVEAVDMPPPTQDATGFEAGSASAATSLEAEKNGGGNTRRVAKAEFRSIKAGTTDVGWGVVRLYRDGEENPWLSTVHSDAGTAKTLNYTQLEDTGGIDEKTCTTLCIPAVPSYLTPSDFLGFVGEKTRALVSHFRMVMTGRMNRYLVLMKFRDSEDARRWRKEWDGRVFNNMEPETCHVVFIKSITFQTPTEPNASFPELSHDPFTPSAASFSKPFPPPTPSLVELPTCPVCLERMDDTSGLLTIPCQHVFHCDCLQKWRGTGCPVCRHTNPSLAAQASSNDHNNLTSSSSHDPPFGSGDASLCSVCDCTDDLWICLICGSVGCGRYKRGHAKDHWKDSAHNFALEIETQHVWDYAGDVWVHRLIRDKGDSKVIELPSRHRDENAGNDDVEMVPREKLDSIGFEYTHLLTSQLESQRVYFEDLVSKAAAKASAAAASASSASARADEAAARLKELALEHARLRDNVVAGLERDLAREKKKGERSAEVARGFGQSLVEEKKVSEGLMKRVEFVNASLEETKRELEKARSENQELREENRDLMFALQAGEKLRAMEEGSKKDGGDENEADDKGNGNGSGTSGLVEGEVLGGTVSLPPPPPSTERGGKRKGKGRGR